MADDVVLNPGTGGDVMAAEDVGGKKHQLVKLEFGDAHAPTLVSTSTPLPVTLAPTGANATAVKVDASSVPVPVTDNGGSVTVDNAGTFAVQIAAGATSIGKAEDMASADGDVGVPAIMVRKASPANTSGTDGDYEFLQGSGGRLWVDASGVTLTVGSHQVTNAGTFAVQLAAGAAAIGKAEDTVAADADVGVPAMMIRQSSPANTSSANGDYEMLQGNNGRLYVDASGVAVPITDNSGSLTVDNGGTFAVQVSAALPAGTNAIGKLAANSGVDIGDVDVTTVGTITPGTAATSLGKAEDAAHASGDVGVLMLGVRQDTDGTPVSADGDYHALQFDASGNLKVNIKAGAGSGGTSIADNATFTRGTTSETPVAGVVETSAPTLTAGKAGALSLTTGGALRVDIASGGLTARAEDSAAVDGADGIAVLAVRRDSASSGVSADGDYANLSVDSNGALRVTGASGTTQYTEDVASAGAESLVLAGAVRRDTAASSSGTDGDYSTLNTDASGRLWVNASGVAVPVTDNSGSLTVDNAGTFAVQLAAGAAAIGKAEDTVAADADVGVPAMMIRQSSPANTSSANGDYEMLQGNAGRLWVDASGVTLTVGSHQVTNAGTFAVQLAAGAAAIGKAEDTVAADADVGVPAMMIRKASPANTSSADGDYEMLQGSAGRLWVDASGVTLTVGSHAVTNAGTFATQESGTQVQVDDAAFTPATSKVQMAGFTADDTSTDSVNEGDGGAARMTLNRKQIVQPYESEPNSWSYAAPAGGLVNTTEVTAKAAAGAGLRNYITSLQVINSHATQGTEVQVLDGTAGTVIHRSYAAPAGGGYTVTFPVPLKTTANTLVSIKEATATATAGVLVNLQGYVGA